MIYTILNWLIRAWPRVDVRNNNCLYVSVCGYVIYLDDSTRERIIDCWRDSDDRVIYSSMSPQREI